MEILAITGIVNMFILKVVQVHLRLKLFLTEHITTEFSSGCCMVKPMW